MSKNLSYVHKDEVLRGDRFEFGKNWSNFLSSITQDNIEKAKKSLTESLGLKNFKGCTFLAAGSGSGLFSLAAVQLGATVTSFDYDPVSVECTKVLRDRYCKDKVKWSVLHGSVLDKKFLLDLGGFDIVYSWGVLHHTGFMWEGIDNLLLCKPKYVYLAIYNDQEFASLYWNAVKKMYNANFIFKLSLLCVHFPYLYLFRKLKSLLIGGINYRGMNLWIDMLDWLGGIPFEVATPHDIIKYYKERNFLCSFIKTVGNKLGCNEYVFVHKK